jgi:6-phosphogluconolactonase
MAAEGGDLEQAAREYERTLRTVLEAPVGQIPQLDLIVLGMGADGHIASLMPDSQILSETKSLVCAADAPKGGLSRLTLTVPVITAARKIMVLVSGREKAAMLARILEGQTQERRYPAQRLWPAMDRVVWLADAQAAENLLG